MARNLARQPETPAALDFLARAQGVRRGAVHALQTGLQPGEQRQADGLTRTTLRRTWQRHRVAERLDEATQHLGTLARRRGAIIEDLNHLASTLREVAARALATVQPIVERVAGQRRDRPRSTPEHEMPRSREPDLGM
jgi:hypothetical protein